MAKKRQMPPNLYAKFSSFFVTLMISLNFNNIEPVHEISNNLTF